MKTLTIPGGQLAYWDTGSGQPLVLIHGVGTSGELWQSDIAELSSDCRLIVYDRRGYGASSKSPSDWRAHSLDVAALIEALGAAPALVVGYSGGSIVALDLALERPELVAGVLLLDPAFNVKRCLTPGLVKARLGALLLGRLRGERSGAQYWVRYTSSYPSGGSAFDRASEERRERLLANASGVFADLHSGGGEHVDESRFAQIKVPVTIVEAMLSPSFLRKSCTRLKKLFPQARTVSLAQSGHHLAVDAREELLTTLRAFVRSVPAQ
jgi:pimeloyl-ACP methyl ester carboxylesterase